MASQSKVVPDVCLLLADAEGAIKEILLDDPNARGEAKQWLISTIAHLDRDSLPSTVRVNCFDPCSAADSSTGHTGDRSHAAVKLSSRKDQRKSSRSGVQDRPYSSSKQQQQHQTLSPIASCKQAVLQLLHLLCSNKPAAVSALLCRDPNFLCSYLTSSSAVTHAWFGQFSLSGIQHFKFGARALANYALTHRTEVWQYLIWAGKHDQAPVAVAGKPHYFAELNVDKTMLQLARHCPEFWSSEELLKSCEAGEWLQLDASHIAEELYRLLTEPRSSRHGPLRQLMYSYLSDAEWTLLCNRLLPLLPDQQLLSFVQQLAAAAVAWEQGAVRQGGSSRGQPHQQQRRATRTDEGIRAQQQQQQPHTIPCWLQRQAAFNHETAAAAAAGGGGGGGGGRGSATDMLAAAAAAVQASQLPCAQHPPPILLSAHVQHWTFNQLLMVNALNHHRRQLLSLIRQDEDAGQQLQELAALGQQLIGDPGKYRLEVQGPPGDSATTAAAAAAVTPASIHVLLVSATSDKCDSSKTAQLQLQLLLAGWLLWLQLLQAAAAAAGPEQAQQALQQLGCTGRLMLAQGIAAGQHNAAIGAAGGGLQQLLQQQLQQQGQEQQQHQHQHQTDGLSDRAGSDSQATPGQMDATQQQQQQQELRQSLRRGAAVASLAHRDSSGGGDSKSSGSSSSSSSSDDSSDSGRVQGHMHVRGKHHKLSKRRKIKLKVGKPHRSTARGAAEKGHRHDKPVGKRKRRRSSSSSSSSDRSSSRDEADSSPHRKAKRLTAAKRRKHAKNRHKKKRRRRHSSGSSSWEDAESVDLDGGGELLNPADFFSWTGAATAAAIPATAAAGASARTTVTDQGALGLKQEEGVRQTRATPDGQRLAGLLDSVGSLSAGGRQWRHGQWLVALPPLRTEAMVRGSGGQGVVAGRGSSSSASQRSIGSSGFSITGTAAEVVEAVVCYCIWQWMMCVHA